ncbi:hypothetical protein RNS23_03100 [Staphylococcus pseudintermedius]|uniref:hypothetical protein n=1 Tax=Staphylococcus pseudintermedius TaxID=283734 RepID=UPI001D94D61F|nr:hypothetical protein [Staphylococcus pseudintermedius]EIA5045348.1 hypothetical protein [Staphylococcus pseudintermedius]EKN5171420.1 hypothetical protein [Staphylococcus pseudintermedius]MCE5639776.1 hypothetical protein [Staphylococcus pseudintermedius]MDK3807137.1 hypothetical protein [Staphylococcus pseudintermedius]MDK4085649.1 hypothetical protein [Staphylococcus pseudintermedius]
MKRVLYLNKKDGENSSKNAHPQKFYALNGIDSSNIFQFEKKILNRINEYNYKLEIEELRYEDISKLFPKANLPSYLHNGIMVREYEVDSNYKIINDCEEVLFEKDNKCFLRVIDAYVFTTMTKNDTRNGYIAQMLFPTLTELMAKFIDSPNYNLLNHPIYVLNVYDKDLPKKIQRNIVQMKVMGIHYIQVFKNLNNYLEREYNFQSFLKTFYSIENGKVDTSDFTLDTVNKTLEVKVNDNMLNDKGKINGSYEKFYYIEVLPIILLSYKNNYSIDLKKLKDFIIRIKGQSKVVSKKVQNLEVIVNYIIKYTGECN